MTATVKKVIVSYRIMVGQNVNAIFADGSVLVPAKFAEEISASITTKSTNAVSVQGTGSFVGPENAVVETPRTYDFLCR